MYQTKDEQLLKVAENILGLNTAMRFASILDLKGNIIEGIMKDHKTSLESQKQQEKFCRDAAKARKMREAYDKKLGKVRYVHTERENVTQITVYVKKYTIFITMEPELSVNKKLQIVTKIKKMAAHL
uniref:Roadblock/LC7 family protein n=2 Tax=environmental samples TaxID=651140 RepID=A0A075HXB6_9ARCH|nr:hypothetical protein [uncultured marine thaumarchaeote KM3_15_A07]AIF20971.1 hypothetical protein [uncultured marine thaumarchaeote KM3_97_A02]